MFEHKTRIRFSEIDKTGRLSMHGLLSLFQDIGYQHALNKGQGMDYTLRTGCTWFLLHWNIEAVSMPSVGQEVYVKTCVYSQQSSLAQKSVWMEDMDGNILAKGDTMWAYFNVIEQHAAHYAKENWWVEDFGEKVELTDKARRINLPKDLTALPQVMVDDYLLDTNEHANNVRLTELAMRLTGKDFGTTHLRAEFREQSPAYKYIYPFTAKVNTEGRETTYLAFKNEEGKTLSVYLFE